MPQLKPADESAQTLAEYSVLVGALVLGVIAAIGFFGGAVASYIQAFATAIGGAA
jgi:Flp pilus assembly pilin Flp